MQAMSLMVHPADQPVPFRTSLDAVLAVSICSVADPPADLELSDAWMFAGYITYVDDHTVPVQLVLDQQGHAQTVSVSVRDHTDGVLTQAHTLTWDKGQPLVLALANQGASTLPWQRMMTSWPFALASALVSMLVLLAGFQTFTWISIKPSRAFQV